MRMPVAMPRRPTSDLPVFKRTSPGTGIQPQGCDFWELLGCGAALAGCAAFSGPALIACVAAAAPGCVKCVT